MRKERCVIGIRLSSEATNLKAISKVVETKAIYGNLGHRAQRGLNTRDQQRNQL